MTRYFLELGAQVAITSRNLEKLEGTAKELSLEAGGQCLAWLLVMYVTMIK